MAPPMIMNIPGRKPPIISAINPVMMSAAFFVDGVWRQFSQRTMKIRLMIPPMKKNAGTQIQRPIVPPKMMGIRKPAPPRNRIIIDARSWNIAPAIINVVAVSSDML